MATRSVGKVSVRVTPDTKRFKADLEKQLQKLEHSLEVKIPTRLDTTKLVEEARRAARAASKAAGVEFQVTADTGKARTQIDEAARDRRSTINVDVDHSSLERVTKVLAGLGAAASKALKISALVGGLSVLAAGAASSAGAVVQLTAALAPLAGLLAGLPATIAGLVAVMGTLKLATMGVGEAMGAALTGDATKLAEAMKDLSPAAQQAVKAVQSLKPAFEYLRNSVQNAFWKGLASQIRATGQALSGPLRAGMTQVASVASVAARQLLVFARNGQTIRSIRTIFDQVAIGMKRASVGLTPLLTGLRDLATSVSPIFQRIGAAIGAAATKFGDWLTQVSRSGQALSWVDSALDVLKQLGTFLGNVGGIIASVFKAASQAGSGFLGVLGQGAAKLNAFFKSAQGQQVLVSIFKGLGQIGRALAPIFTALATAVGKAAPYIGKIATALSPGLVAVAQGLGSALAAMGPGLTQLAHGIAQGLVNLAPALQPLGKAIGGVAAALTPVLPQVASALADALIKLAPSLPGIAKGLADAAIAIIPLIPQIARMLQLVVPLIPPILQLAAGLIKVGLQLGLVAQFQLLNKILSVLSPILTTVVGWFGRLGQWLQNINFGSFTSALQAAAAGIGGFVLRAVTFLASLPVKAASALASLAGTLGGIAVRALTRLTTAVQSGIIRAVTFLASLPGKATAAAASLVGKLGSLASSAMSRLGSAVSSGISRAVGFVSRLPGRARSAASALIGNMGNVASSAFSRMRSAASSGISRVVSLARGLPGRIRSAVGSLGSILYGAGQRVIQGLINGILSMIGNVGSAMSSIASRIRSYLPFSPAKTGPLRTHRPEDSGRSIVRLLAGGLTSNRALLDSAMRQVAGAMVTPGTPALAGATGIGGRGSAVNIENYNEAGKSPRQVAEDLMLLMGARG